MPETVWAIHNFEAEAEDEISFNIGEPIIVLQKDELYQDGWWEVRQLASPSFAFSWHYHGAVVQPGDKPKVGRTRSRQASKQHNTSTQPTQSLSIIPLSKRYILAFILACGKSGEVSALSFLTPYPGRKTQSCVNRMSKSREPGRGCYPPCLYACPFALISMHANSLISCVHSLGRG